MDRRTAIAGLAATLASSPCLAAAPRGLRILCLGDSLTAGFGLPVEAGFVPTLARWLAARGAGDVRLTNAGLSGDTTYGGRVRIGWALRRADYDAVIVELGANDMLLGFDPAKSAANLRSILDTAAAGGRPVMLMGIGAVGRSQAYRRRWDAIWPRVAAAEGALLVPDLYATIRVQPKAARAEWLQADGLHASRKGVASMVDLAGPVVLQLIARARARAG